MRATMMSTAKVELYGRFFSIPPSPSIKRMNYRLLFFVLLCLLAVLGAQFHIVHDWSSGGEPSQDCICSKSTCDNLVTKNDKKDLTRPTMHTFFASLGRTEGQSRTAGMTDGGHEQLLNEWHRAWNEAGWNTVVLTLDDAKKHPNYDSVAAVMSQHSPNEYNSMCFLRWFAMAANGGGWMSDYDTFPLESRAQDSLVLPNDGKFTGFSSHVPCLISGSATEWERMAHELVRVIQLEDYGYRKSDMHALLYLKKFVPNSFIEDTAVFSKYDSYTRLGIVNCAAMNGKRAVHFSHSHIKTIAKKGLIWGIPPDQKEEAVKLRYMIARLVLNQWSDQCDKNDGPDSYHLAREESIKPAMVP